jgi:hypothetical protein
MLLQKFKFCSITKILLNMYEWILNNLAPDPHCKKKHFGIRFGQRDAEPNVVGVRTFASFRDVRFRASLPRSDSKKNIFYSAQHCQFKWVTSSATEIIVTARRRLEYR